MKSISLVLAIVATSAQADVITLERANCGGQRVCQSVPNDANSHITLVSTQAAGPNPGHPVTTIIAGGVAYHGRPAQAGNYSSFDADVVNDAKEVGHLRAQWHSTVRHVNTGRAHYSVTTWFLDFGTFSRP